MARLITWYDASLLEAARKSGKLAEFYSGALPLLEGEFQEGQEIPEELSDFLHQLVEREIQPVIHRFGEMARGEIIDVEIISAVALKLEQLAKIEERLTRLARKQVALNNTIDPSVIGGLRIIVGTMVIDNSIKSQLSRMKEELYKGVYFK